MPPRSAVYFRRVELTTPPRPDAVKLYVPDGQLDPRNPCIQPAVLVVRVWPPPKRALSMFTRTDVPGW